MFDYKDRYANVNIATAPKSQRIALTVFLLVFAVAAFAFAIAGVNGNNRAAMIRSSGTRVTASIVNRYKSRSRDNKNVYYNVVIGYVVNRIPAEHTFEVSSDAYEKTYNRSTTDVYYLPADPSQVILADGGDTNIGPWQVIIPFGAGVLVLALIAWAWIYWIRNGVP